MRLLLPLACRPLPVGITLGITQGGPVINVPSDFAWLGQGSMWGIPFPFIVLCVLVLVTDVLLRNGRTLRQLYYVGGNQKAARFSGIQVNQIILLTFIGSGVAAALGGIMSMAQPRRWYSHGLRGCGIAGDRSLRHRRGPSSRRRRRLSARYWDWFLWHWCLTR